MKNVTPDFIIKKITAIFKSLIVHLTIFTFIISPVSIFAASSKKNDNDNANENTGWNTASALMNQATQMYMQNMSQQASMAQQADLMKQMEITPVPSKYFPSCMIAPMTQTPKGLCESITDNASLSTARMSEQMAEKNINYFKQLQREEQNGKIQQFNNGQSYAATSGVGCLNQNKKLVDSQLQDKLNYIENLSAKIKKQNQLFKEQNQKLLDGMRDVNAELNGNGDSIDAKSQDFGKLLAGSKCSEVLDSNILMGEKGLRGISDFMNKPQDGNKSIRSQASYLIKDQAVIKDQLTAKIRDVEDLIKKGGVNAATTYSKGSEFAGFSNIIKEEADLFNFNYASLKKEYEDLSSTYDSMPAFPSVDRNLSDRLSEINPRYLIKNAAIEECITFDNTMTTDQILGSLEHKTTNNGGLTIVRIRDELSKVLKSDADIEDPNYIENKLNAIKKIDDHYGKGRITLKLGSSYWGNNASHGYTAYELYSNMYKQCEQQYNAGQIDSAKKSQVDNMLTRLQDFKEEERLFTSNLSNKLGDEILNCPDRSSGRSGQCDANSLQTDKEGFCLKIATSCAHDVTNCYTKVAHEVKIRENQIKTFAGQYNTNTEQFIASQEQYFAQLKAQVDSETGVLKQFFEGANFEINSKDSDKLFIAMPELSMDKELGVNLRDPDMKFLENLPEALQTLKEQIAAQKVTIDAEIDKHIDDQRQVLADNIQVWETLATDCAGAEKEYAQMVKKRNEDMKKQYDEGNQELSDFCQKYDMLRTSRVPTCGNENSPSSLATESIKISKKINPDITAHVGQYRDLCNSYEGDKTAEGAEEDEVPLVIEVCFSGDKLPEKTEIKASIDGFFDMKNIDFTYYAEMDVTSDEYKELSPAAKGLVKTLKGILDNESICQNKFDTLKKEEGCTDANTDLSTCHTLPLIKKFRGMSAKELKSGAFKYLASAVRKVGSTGGNSEWSKLGEQDISSCTANNNVQTGMKQATNDIMSLQQGMMNSTIGQ